MGRPLFLRRRYDSFAHKPMRFRAGAALIYMSKQQAAYGGAISTHVWMGTLDGYLGILSVCKVEVTEPMASGALTQLALLAELRIPSVRWSLCPGCSR